MILPRVTALMSELRSVDARDRVLALVVAGLAGVHSAYFELQDLAVDPAIRSAALGFLEALRALRDSEREREADERFFATARLM